MITKPSGYRRAIFSQPSVTINLVGWGHKTVYRGDLSTMLGTHLLVKVLQEAAGLNQSAKGDLTQRT